MPLAMIWLLAGIYVAPSQTHTRTHDILKMCLINAIECFDCFWYYAKFEILSKCTLNAQCLTERLNPLFSLTRLTNTLNQLQLTHLLLFLFLMPRNVWFIYLCEVFLGSETPCQFTARWLNQFDKHIQTHTHTHMAHTLTLATIIWLKTRTDRKSCDARSK